MLKKFFIGLVFTIIAYIGYLVWDASSGGNSSHLYENLCADCHGFNGEGFKDLYPPLAGSDYMKKADLSIACIIRNGLDSPIEVNGKAYHQPMPAFKELSEVEITNLVNYISNQWGNQRKFARPEEVKRVLAECK